jgi:hypothetical protein
MATDSDPGICRTCFEAYRVITTPSVDVTREAPLKAN